jgi:fructose-1,6-bisphosphatase/inositol monophosphatase family enzyme
VRYSPRGERSATMADLEALVEVLRGVGRAVAAEVRALVAGPDAGTLADEVGLGADGAPTSRIDAVAEVAAMAHLERLPPRWRFNILSEELGLIDRGAALTLVIDPIDATNNAITGFPYYAFSVAAVDTRPLAACVLNLPTDDCWTAARGHGAALNGRRLPPRPVTEIGRALFAAVRPMTEADLARLRPILFGGRRLRITGCTALDVCLIASGALDAFANPNRYTNPLWGEKVVDYAGAALVLEETGGALSDQAGRALAYPLDVRQRLCLQAGITPELLAAVVAALGTGRQEGAPPPVAPTG